MPNGNRQTLGRYRKLEAARLTVSHREAGKKYVGVVTGVPVCAPAASPLVNAMAVHATMKDLIVVALRKVCKPMAELVEALRLIVRHRTLTAHPGSSTASRP